MEQVFRSLIQQFREFYRNLSPTKRASIIVVSIISFVTLAIVIAMTSGRSYVPLFVDIPSAQVPTIVAVLQEKNIPFDLRENGRTIAVPSDLLHSTQMALMAEIGSSNLGSVGLEIFDKQDFGTNTYAQRVNYQRALQGELIRAINTLAAVRQSKVILALPTRKTFLEETTPPSASVVVELHRGRTLAADQIRGIRHLVASSVEGMEPERVTVVDDRGKMLSRGSDSETTASSDLMDMKRMIEANLEQRIEDILGRVVGQGKVIARVDATLSNKAVTALEELVDAEGSAILSQVVQEEALDGARVNPAGVPGARANLPGAEDAGQVGFNQNVRKETRTTNFEVPRTTRNVRQAAGGIERLSVAVLVDGVELPIAAEDGTTRTEWNPRSEEEIQRFESLVRSAVGFNEQRGDSVRVENIQFTQEDFSEAERLLTTLERKQLLHVIFKWALLGFSLALFFIIVVRPFMQWITDSFQETVEEMLPRTIEELEELQAVDDTLPGMSAALPMLDESIDPDKAESELLKDRIMSLMSQNQKKAASAFSIWTAKKEG